MNDRIINGIVAVIGNGTVLGFVTLADIELILKIVLLFITISYTSFQFWKAARKEDK